MQVTMCGWGFAVGSGGFAHKVDVDSKRAVGSQTNPGRMNWKIAMDPRAKARGAT